MSSPRFANLIAEYPSERGAIRRLERLVRRSRERGHDKAAVTLERLLERANPQSPRLFIAILDHLIDDGEIGRFVRVESRSGHGGIGDFESVLEVPERIYDERVDQEVVVTPDDLRVLYRL